MLWWLYRIFVGSFKQHEHVWEVYKQGTWSDPGMGTSGNYFVLQCAVCGDLKSKKV